MCPALPGGAEGPDGPSRDVLKGTGVPFRRVLLRSHGDFELDNSESAAAGACPTSPQGSEGPNGPSRVVLKGTASPLRHVQLRSRGDFEPCNSESAAACPTNPQGSEGPNEASRDVMKGIECPFGACFSDFTGISSPSYRPAGAVPAPRFARDALFPATEDPQLSHCVERGAT
jgi:hypothetical protein